MKVLKGQLKGRNIFAPIDVRATSAIVKKACFDILGSLVCGQSVLDLFCGSGSLGIEALSCEAKRAVFVDNDPLSIQAVKKNLKHLKLEQKSQVYTCDAFRLPQDPNLKSKKFDLIFLDPPYYHDLVRKALHLIEYYDILAAFGHVVTLRYFKDKSIENSQKLEFIKEKSYGQTVLTIYQRL